MCFASICVILIKNMTEFTAQAVAIQIYEILEVQKMSLNKSSKIRALAGAAALSLAIALTPAAALTSLAATGTVTASNVNVRSDASTSSSVVGTANSGQTLQVGDSKVDSSGATWYQVTLASGNTGYIRSDLISVTEDEPAQADPVQPVTPADTASEAPVDTGSDTSATTGDTGGYQIVYAPDDTGEMTFYLYNNTAGERMKLSDIEALQTRATNAEKEAKAVKNRYRTIFIVLIVLLVAALAAAILLFLRLRDALTNGRRERDLTQERKNARRTGSNADDISALRRRESAGSASASRAASRDRSEAYASASRTRAERDGEAGEMTRRTASAARPASGAARPASQEGYASRPRTGAERPVREASDERRTASAETRRVSTDAARPVRRAAEPVREGAPRTAERPVRESRPASSEERAPQQAARRTRNFAGDQEFDYDFINLDDDKK